MGVSALKKWGGHGPPGPPGSAAYEYCILPGGKNYRYSIGIYKYSMRFRVPAFDQSDCSVCYNYDLNKPIVFSGYIML